MNDLKKSEIKQLLDENNIEYKSSSKKSELIELLKTIYEEEEEDILSDVEEEEVKEEEKEEEKKPVKKWVDRYYYVNGIKHKHPRDKNSYYYVLE